MDSKIIEKLDSVIERYMDLEAFPGVSVGVVYNKKILYTKGFGVKNISTKEPITEHSLFHMASVSKTFVCIGIMQLAEKGKIDLDGALVDYLPYFKLDDSRYKEITIRQLLSHTSGMPDEEDYEWDKPQYDDEALERYVRSIEGKKLMWSPGEKFAYSNIAYEILGDVIAKVSGMSFEDYMKNNILSPLNMSESTFFKPETSKDLLTTPHVIGAREGYVPVVSEIFPYNRYHGPSSTLYSNLVELCNYAIANLNHGKFKDSIILKEDSYLEMWKEHSETGWIKKNSNVGLTWFLGEYKGYRFISHSGLDTGFMSILALVPEKGVAAIIMTNSDYIGTGELLNSTLNIVLEEEEYIMQKSLVHHLNSVLFKRGLEEALKEYNKIKDTSMEDYFLNEGEFDFIVCNLLEIGQYEESIKILEMATKIFKDSANLFCRLGEVYLDQENKEAAIINYKKSLEINPNNLELKELLEKVMSE
ncbi:serine hydrolase [Clostridium hydrogeniformans]|uniref:serine hydrolase n=1 Tax=Clostridium hydrogeniformans TaxID=349933 RepID=UPI00054F6BFB|nr:serine hydrolase [Clostridium hydrogeniformans]